MFENIVSNEVVFDCLSAIYPKIRNQETDEVYKKVFDNSALYCYYISDYYKPYIYLKDSGYFTVPNNHKDYYDNPLSTKYYWLLTKKEVHNAYNLFGSLCDDSIMNQCKKIIDIKQLIHTLFYIEDVHNIRNIKIVFEDYTYDSLKSLYNRMSPNSFYFCGFTKSEWNQYIKDKPINIDYFIKVFNNLVYKLYQNIIKVTKDKDGIISQFKELVDGEYVYHKYRIDNIIYAANAKNGCTPTFMPQSYEWFYTLVNFSDSIGL